MWRSRPPISINPAVISKSPASASAKVTDVTAQVTAPTATITYVVVLDGNVAQPAADLDRPGGDQQVAGIRERQGDRRHGPGHGTHRDDHLRGRARRQCGAAGRRSHDHRQPERVGGQRVLRGRTDIEFVDMRGGIMARINRRSRSERGMTLVEVLVAMAIMSIVLLVFTSVLGSVQSGVARQDSLSQTLDQAR